MDERFTANHEIIGGTKHGKNRTNNWLLHTQRLPRPWNQPPLTPSTTLTDQKRSLDSSGSEVETKWTLCNDTMNIDMIDNDDTDITDNNPLHEFGGLWGLQTRRIRR
jgi:hypothetical protein